MLEAGASLAEGRYVVEARIGQGGMATVWRIVDARLRPFALKVLTLDRPEVRERFQVEAQIQLTLDHPNLVRAIEVLEIGGEPALVMEYVPGRALDAWLLQHADAPRGVRDRIARQVIEAVAHAHGKGLVHRDLKPANVLVLETEDGPIPKVTDFGLAKQLGGMAATKSGIALGTPRYMAPEQIRDAKRVDARADVWSLGALLYELYTGQPAFQRETLIDIFTAVMNGELVDPAEHGVTGPVRDGILGCLRVDPAARWQSCAELLEAMKLAPLRRAVTPPPQSDAVAPPSPTIVAPESDPEPVVAVVPPAPPVVAVVPPARSRYGGWVLAWSVALGLVVAAFGVGMTVVGVVWLGQTVAEPDPIEAPAPAERPRPRRRR